MKQYTTPEQTVKLIELGYDRPKFEIETQLCNIKGEPLRAATIVGDYSIGELIEMLPKVTEDEDCEYVTLQIYFDLFNWIVEYTGVDVILYATSSIELIDALYDMIVRLKEEGVI